MTGIEGAPTGNRVQPSYCADGETEAQKGDGGVRANGQCERVSLRSLCWVTSA